MRRYYFKLPIILLAICLAMFFACKKEEKKTVEDITAVSEKVYTPTAPKKQYPLYPSYAWFALEDNKIFHGSYFNTGITLADTQFMQQYDIPSNSFSLALPSYTLFADTAGNKLLGYNGYLYMVSGSNVRYNISAKKWDYMASPFPFLPSDNAYGNGKGILNNRIYVLGGKAFPKKFVYCDIASDTWFDAADISVPVNNSALVGVSGMLYTLGNTLGTDRTFASYDPSSNTWTTLPDLPFAYIPNKKNNIAVNFSERFIIILQGNKLYIYDTHKNAWKSNAIDLNISEITYAASLLISGTTLYVAGISSEREFTLYKLKIDNVPK